MATNDQVIQGGRELDQLLQTLPAKVEKNVLRAGLRAGAVVLRDEAKQRTPVSSGALRNSVRISSRARGGSVSVSVKAGNSVAWYAHLVEYGTRPHVIRAKPGSALQFGGTTAKTVHHPGARAQPFMRPAVDAATPAALAAVKVKIRDRLTKEGLSVPPIEPPDEAAV